MKELNVVLTELGISKVRLAKYLGVSRQMLYNYLTIDDLNNWPKEKAAKLLSLLNIECIKDLTNLTFSLDLLFIIKVCSIVFPLNFILLLFLQLQLCHL